MSSFQPGTTNASAASLLKRPRPAQPNLNSTGGLPGSVVTRGVDPQPVVVGHTDTPVNGVGAAAAALVRGSSTFGSGYMYTPGWMGQGFHAPPQRPSFDPSRLNNGPGPAAIPASTREAGATVEEVQSAGRIINIGHLLRPMRSFSSNTSVQNLMLFYYMTSLLDSSNRIDVGHRMGKSSTKGVVMMHLAQINLMLARRPMPASPAEVTPPEVEARNWRFGGSVVTEQGVELQGGHRSREARRTKQVNMTVYSEAHVHNVWGNVYPGARLYFVLRARAHAKNGSRRYTINNVSNNINSPSPNHQDLPSAMVSSGPNDVYMTRMDGTRVRKYTSTPFCMLPWVAPEHRAASAPTVDDLSYTDEYGDLRTGISYFAGQVRDEEMARVDQNEHDTYMLSLNVANQRKRKLMEILVSAQNEECV